MDIYIYCMMGFLSIFMVFLLVAKRRMDRNEPVMGWKRKQHIHETGGTPTPASVSNKKEQKQAKKERDNVKDLIGIEDIQYGIFKKKNNEYCVIILTDSVNYDLLSEQARQSIIMGYRNLFRVIRFPIQILGQAVRQDLSKEVQRWTKNLKKGNSATYDYNMSVINHIKDKSENEFRISRKIYYIISFIPQPSKMGALKPEQRDEMIRNELYQRAATVTGMLRQCDIHSDMLDSLGAMEVMKRALNRDRMVIHPISDLISHGKEKLSTYVTADVMTLPGYDDLVYDSEEVRKIVQASEESEVGNQRIAG